MRTPPRLIVLWILLVTTSAVSGCDAAGHLLWPGVQGSGTIVTRTRSVAAFQRVAVAGSFDVVIRAGAEPGLELSGDDNLLELVRTTVADRTLRIDTTRSIRSRTPIRVVVSTPSLEALTVSGSSRVGARGIRGGAFELVLSGSGDVIAEAHVRQVTAAVSGSGSARLYGEAQRVDARVSGSGELDLAKVTARVGDVRVSGSGDVDVNASERLVTDVSGSGSVRYVGRPRLTRQISGSGSVRRR